MSRVAEIGEVAAFEVEAATAALRSANCPNSYIEVKTADILLMGFRSMAEYDHYAEHMNRLIAAAGGTMGLEEHDAHTQAYNEHYGTCVALLPQIPVAIGDKDHEQGDIASTKTEKLEVHMESKQNDTATTVISNAINAIKAMPVSEQRALLESHGVAVPSAPAQSQASYLSSIDQSLATMTKKNLKSRAVTVAETAAGVAVGVGIAYGLFKAGEYFFSGE